MDIPASRFDEGPVYICCQLYDLTGKPIAGCNRRFNWESYDASFTKGANYFFSGALKNIIENTNDSFESEKVSVQEWTAPGYSFSGKAMVCLAPVTTSAGDIADLLTFALTFGESAMAEAAKRLHGIMLTHNEAAPLRMEMDVCSFEGTYRRVEPGYTLVDKTDTDYDNLQHDNDIFSDERTETRHWTEAETTGGSCKLDFQVAVSIKLYDRVTNQLVYSYIGSSNPDRQMDGFYRILADYYGRLKEKLNG